MARVTIEKTFLNVKNHFELVVLVAYRANQIACGGRTMIKTKDKPSVIALREIEAETIKLDVLRENILQRFIFEEKTPMSNMSFASTNISFDSIVREKTASILDTDNNGKFSEIDSSVVKFEDEVDVC